MRYRTPCAKSYKHVNLHTVRLIQTNSGEETHQHKQILTVEQARNTHTYQKHHDYKNPTLHALNRPIWTTDTDLAKRSLSRALQT